MNPDEVVIPKERLHELSVRMLQSAGVDHEKAELVADSLVEASLRGVDSHGLQLLPYYVERIRQGALDHSAQGRLVSESGACALFDGQNGLGQWVALQCSDHAIRLAREHGVGVVVARESNHFGAAAFWGERIIRAGFIGMVTCNASPSVCPWQGRERRFGTNPICFAVPGDPPVFLLDMATTTVAMGKLYKADICGQDEIPYGWAVDSKGRPTTSAAAAFAGSLMPLGGYKGYGLAMMAEILCAVLAGGVFGPSIPNVRVPDRPGRASQFFLALDPSRFGPPEAFEARMRDYVGLMKSSAPAEGYDEVLVAGDPEWRLHTERSTHGIPLSAALWRKIQDLETA